MTRYLFFAVSVFCRCRHSFVLGAVSLAVAAGALPECEPFLSVINIGTESGIAVGASAGGCAKADGCKWKRIFA